MRKIVIHPDVCNGQPTLEGTRITAQTILEFLGAGDSPEDVVRQYPALTEDDVRNALKYYTKPSAQSSTSNRVQLSQSTAFGRA